MRSISLSFSFDFMQIEKNTAILSIHICINCNEMTKKWPKKITSIEAGRGQRAPAVWSVAGAGGVEAGGGRPGLPGWRAAGAWPAAGPRLGGDARAQPAAAQGPAASLGLRGPRAAASPQAAGGRGGPGRCWRGSRARRAWAWRPAGVGPASVGCRRAERGRQPA